MHEWFFAIFALLAAAACGAGAVAPFVEICPLIPLAAPLAGILIVPLFANVFYVLEGCHYRIAALHSFLLCLVFSAVMIHPILRSRSLRWLPLAAILATAISVPLMDAATLRFGSSILMIDTTDQGGYSQVADWLNSHRVNDPPHADASLVYESWPEETFRFDPRCGSFGLLAIFSELHGTPGIFTYDIATAIVLAAGCLAVAAVFAKSRRIFLLLCLGLFASQWFDLAHMGYLSKLIAYPSILFLAGLALHGMKSASTVQTFTVVLISCALGIMFPGPAVSILIGAILLPALAGLALFDRRALASVAALCAMTIVIPTVASGLMARPTPPTRYGPNKPWVFVLPRALDLESGKNYSITGLPSPALLSLSAASLAIAAAVLCAALWRKETSTIGLLAGPLLLLCAFYCIHDNRSAMQLLGFIYPAGLCALCLCVQGAAEGERSCHVPSSGTPEEGQGGGVFPPFSRHKPPPQPSPGVPEEGVKFQIRSPWGAASQLWYKILFAAAAGFIALRLPRAWQATHRYVLDPPPTCVFTLSEMDQIASKVGSDPVRIDLSGKDRLGGVYLLIETGRRQMNIQWSQGAWFIAAGYRNWPLPQPTTPTKWILRRSEHGIANHQFDLIGPG